MERIRLIQKFKDYKKAVERLSEVLEADLQNEFIYDAAIQRFEFTYELSWKLIKGFLSYSGIAEVLTPREVFKEAFSVGLILEGEKWIEMLKDRNLTSHVYDEEMAKDIYVRVKNIYMELFIALVKKIEVELKK